MKSTIVKFRKFGLAGIMGVSLFAVGSTSFAADNDIDYSFTLKPGYGNSYSSPEYRQTENTKNAWKVEFNHSTEGSGTKATYWLDKSGSLVSDTWDMYQGKTYYKNALSTASQANVRLGVENNNYSTESFTVTGYWDEETGKDNKGNSL